MPGEIRALVGAFLFGCEHNAIRKAHDDGWDTFNCFLTVTVVNLACYVLAAAAQYCSCYAYEQSRVPTASVLGAPSRSGPRPSPAS